MSGHAEMGASLPPGWERSSEYSRAGHLYWMTEIWCGVARCDTWEPFNLTVGEVTMEDARAYFEGHGWREHPLLGWICPGHARALAEELRDEEERAMGEYNPFARWLLRYMREHDLSSVTALAHALDIDHQRFSLWLRPGPEAHLPQGHYHAVLAAKTGVSVETLQLLIRSAQRERGGAWRRRQARVQAEA